MKKLMLGNEAVARGLYEAGCAFVSSYPGTPSTEITECAAKYDEIYAEWAPNEKVALEAAIGASTAGVRAFAGMKHVGLNVAADPLFIGAYIGVSGGLVVGVADDPGMHSSQNEQDSRHYAEAAKLPMLEPCDSDECLRYTKAAFELSERFDTPVILRMNTRVSHSQSVVEPSERAELEPKPYEKLPPKRVMMPGYAKPRHVAVEARLAQLRQYSEDCPFNRIILGDKKLGIVTSGPSYNYAREVFGDSATYLVIGMPFPLPEKLFRDFAGEVERVIVIEELDPVLETHIKSLGIACDGKNLLSLTGEYSQRLLAEKLLGIKAQPLGLDEPLPARPPVLCPGCPHRGVFYTFKKLKLTVMGDIGCYTLGAAPPLSAMDTTLCMGASISSLHGFLKARPDFAARAVAVIGDSTFLHSGITGLLNITYNRTPATVVIVDNSITGMTGHQENPATGRTLKGVAVPAASLEKICEGAGVRPERIRVVGSLDTAALEGVLREELAAAEPSVIIARHPCALLKNVKRGTPHHVDADKCRGCRACMAVACPCISFADGKAHIDPALCFGCGLCAKLCRFGAINI
jgi:indolepyruvate ferredoxin oxidoreductase, alpha subunit